MSDFSHLNPKEQLREINNIISSGEPAPWTMDELRYLYNAIATSMGELHFPYKNEAESLAIIENLIETHIEPEEQPVPQSTPATAPKSKQIDTNLMILVIVVVFSIVLTLVGTVVTTFIQK